MGQQWEELLNEYDTKFRFPYFGFNWDALEDCLRDLDWIPRKEVIVYHPVLPTLEIKELKIYLEILRDITKHWTQNEEHSFNAYFNYDDYSTVYKIMKHIWIDIIHYLNRIYHSILWHNDTRDVHNHIKWSL